MSQALKLASAIFMVWGLSACSITQSVLKAKYTGEVDALCRNNPQRIYVYAHDKDLARFHYIRPGVESSAFSIFNDTEYALVRSIIVLKGSARSQDAKIVKYLVQVVRKRDNKLLGELLNYKQEGGDWGARETYTTHYCAYQPELEQLLLHEIFSEK